MQLTRQNILKCGFFPDNMPSKVFSSIEISDFIEIGSNYLILSSNLASKNIKSTPCLFISSHKNDMERRIIAIPHIETYAVLCNEIENNALEIQTLFSRNDKSYSNIIQPSSVEGYDIKSNFLKNYLDRTIYSTGYKYLLKLDLSKCYENIYTHSITWSMYGKEKSKLELLKPKKTQDPQYKKIDDLDTCVRSINNNETKGVPTGPLSSRIISEVILTSIDNILSSEGYHFKRYVDDYNFYFRNEVEIHEFLPRFQNLLYDYKQHINTEKTQVQKYPYQLMSDFSDELKNHDFSNKGFLNYIEKAIELHNFGHKGALKYALKVIGKMKVPNKEKDVVFAHIINLMLTYPNLSEHIHVLILNNSFTFNVETETTVNEILKHCIKNRYEIETIWLLTIMGSLKMEINAENLCSILDQAEPLTTILALDYIKYHSLHSSHNIKNAISVLKLKLKTEKVYGEKWLLIYEINKNKWITGLKSNLNDSPFLKLASDNNVSFFKSPLL